MDILIPDIWLRDYLKTKANYKDIAKYLSFCGPSVERIIGKGEEAVYSIEVTTNRVDSASVYGIAREAAAILPRFGLKAKLINVVSQAKQRFVKKVNYLTTDVGQNLCPRFSAILIKNVKIKDSPLWLQKRLSLAEARPINNVVDISNFIMLELGQPVHTFDYDKIKNHKMILRTSNKGEKITTLDAKTYTLPGGNIVIEDGEKRLIDLAGIMGGLNSAVDKNTKNVLLFVQTYNPVNIRRTSMSLSCRTEAAMLFEKDLDPELVSSAMKRGIELFVSLTEGKPEDEILDIYPTPYKVKKISTNIEFVESRLGIQLPKAEISKILLSLGFKASWKGKKLEIIIPSFRFKDINIPEDIIEEIARMYGYHNLPGRLMEGGIPNPPAYSSFEFEQKIKNILKGYGGVEVYTLSLVSKEKAGIGALKLINPLGKESEYLRISLLPSLVTAAKENSGEKEPFHLFEMANIYLPRENNLPEEKLMLGSIFSNTQYRQAKGIMESLLEELNIDADLTAKDSKHFLPSHRLLVKNRGLEIGQFGVLEENNLTYYEFDTESLKKAASEFLPYKPIPTFPPQIEDITLIFPAKTKIGEVINTMKSISQLINNSELTTIYKDSYTFRIWYQHPTKTLRDKEVEEIRNKILEVIKTKFGGTLKN